MQLRAEREFTRRIAGCMRLAERLAGKYGSPRYDSLNEAYLGLVIASRTFKPERGEFPHYAYRVIENRLINLRKRRYAQTVDWQEIEGTEDRDSIPYFDRLLAGISVQPVAQKVAERRELMRVLLKRLTRAEKRLLLLLWRGESQSRIGERIGLSQSSVSRRVRTLGQKVRREIRSYQE